MPVRLRMLLTAVACVCSMGSVRKEDHLTAASSAPAVPAVAGGIDLRLSDNVAAPATASFLRIGATGTFGGGTQLWANPHTRGTTLQIAPLIADAASRAGLPYDFLYRLLVKESGLRPDAVSPKGALGIAQFMPATALERGLSDPFDPQAAVLKAAELLREHTTRFGNLGLAAAAYNAGPGRVDRWLGGMAAMPLETRAYVRAITGREVESWSPAGRISTAPGAAQWTALVGPSSEPAAPRSATVGPDRAGAASAIVLPPRALAKTPSSKTDVALTVRSAKTKTAERVVQSEQALCDLMNERGQTCFVRQIY
ncbi:lytic transglycosylase domain-containing protein [Methylobacterium sp. WL103]|uniref:lytic transglycosylase domain-containing protein n=1 Tax=unclassified Methylobacterium TaxID=2615210 RepID=UPI0011CC36AC|nr:MULTISPECIES: lytic transglycosylase domain-containing protein [unclassified Methylobacterium]TXM64374.1 lytic transglycosylase domain-containing protein [Methylobacterium sp. WL120]TXN07395.1 lytic transglycosylase domain-containing protein [Methylobacterium sp. WL103]